MEYRTYQIPSIGVFRKNLIFRWSLHICCVSGFCDEVKIFPTVKCPDSRHHAFDIFIHSNFENSQVSKTWLNWDAEIEQQCLI